MHLKYLKIHKSIKKISIISQPGKKDITQLIKETQTRFHDFGNGILFIAKCEKQNKKIKVIEWFFTLKKWYNLESESYTKEAPITKRNMHFPCEHLYKIYPLNKEEIHEHPETLNFKKVFKKLPNNIQEFNDFKSLRANTNSYILNTQKLYNGAYYTITPHYVGQSMNCEGNRYIQTNTIHDKGTLHDWLLNVTNTNKIKHAKIKINTWREKEGLYKMMIPDMKNTIYIMDIPYNIEKQIPLLINKNTNDPEYNSITIIKQSITYLKNKYEH